MVFHGIFFSMAMKTSVIWNFLKECFTIVSRIFFHDVDTYLASSDSSALPFDQINSIFLPKLKQTLPEVEIFTVLTIVLLNTQVGHISLS